MGTDAGPGLCVAMCLQKIKDPSAKKPEDWDEEEEIEDPNDKKPDNWDKIEPTIPDKDAKKPDDWNEEEDGV